jgi:hypothetical protein
MTIGEFNSGIIAKADVATTPAASPTPALRSVPSDSPGTAAAAE